MGTNSSTTTDVSFTRRSGSRSWPGLTTASRATSWRFASIALGIISSARTWPAGGTGRRCTTPAEAAATAAETPRARPDLGWGRDATLMSSPPPRRRRLRRWLWVLPVLAVVAGIAVLAAVYAFASIPLPSQVELASAAEVYDRDGELIGIYSGEERRFLIDTSTLPKFVAQAVVASEDRDFYDHSGVSLRGILRAAWANLTGGTIRQGGSTITQQYIKNAVLRDPSRTLDRKAREAVLALKLERRFSKRQILGFYLNTIYLGRGAYGIEAAAAGRARVLKRVVEEG